MSIVVFGGNSDMAPEIVKLFPETVVHCLSKEEADVREMASVDRAVSYYKPEWVINLAGVSNLQYILNADREQWKEEIEINLIGSFNIAHACAHKKLGMIFLGSVAGLYGKPHHAGYSASKAGVISLVQSLGMEGYNAYAISPGRVDTKLREKDFPGERKETRLTVKEVADVVRDIIEGKYEPGDNIVIRRLGTETQPLIIDTGEPWKDWLQVGQPPVV